MQFSEISWLLQKGLKSKYTEGNAWQRSLRLYLQVIFWKSSLETDKGVNKEVGRSKMNAHGNTVIVVAYFARMTLKLDS